MILSDIVRFRPFRCTQCGYRIIDIDSVDYLAGRCKTISCPVCGVENVPTKR